jgi:hypothetical protein
LTDGEKSAEAILVGDPDEGPNSTAKEQTVAFDEGGIPANRPVEDLHLLDQRHAWHTPSLRTVKGAQTLIRLWHYTNVKIPELFSKINWLQPACLR